MTKTSAQDQGGTANGSSEKKTEDSQYEAVYLPCSKEDCVLRMGPMGAGYKAGMRNKEETFNGLRKRLFP